MNPLFKESKLDKVTDKIGRIFWNPDEDINYWSNSIRMVIYLLFIWWVFDCYVNAPPRVNPDAMEAEASLYIQEREEYERKYGYGYDE